ncbi:methyltransferase [Candidatus Poribacteria bacterium]|nr:methyltransferase [Candidatus Poribacteria bacterium]
MTATAVSVQPAAHSDVLPDTVRDRLPQVDLSALKTRIPALAKDSAAMQAIEQAAQSVPTTHDLVLGDARNLDGIADASVHLVVTSPPYWTLKDYGDTEGQLGAMNDYEEFLGELDHVWRDCQRVLVEGGRLIIVVGDVCLSRREHGRHMVVPLHASIQERCRVMGYENLNPILWHKIANATLEVQNGGSFLGKPFEPNAVIKNDLEYILMQRKPKAYRTPSPAARLPSVISAENHATWFRQIWDMPGASTKTHPAPYPAELAERLIRMFSFVGDTVLDPFMGSGTTNVAASRWGRNSVGYEISSDYVAMAGRRMQAEQGDMFRSVTVTVRDHG